MRSSRKPLGFWAGTVLFSLLLSLAPVHAATSAKKVRLAYAGWGIGTAVAYVGIDSGLFKQYDLDVEEIFIKDALSGSIQSLIGADFVLGFGNPALILQPVLAGADIVFVGSHVNMEQYRMAVAADVESIQDLKGKKVGVSELGSKSDLIARVMLRRGGLDPVKDVQIVAAGFSPNRVAAISKNLIQGAPVSPDVAAQAKQLGIKVLEGRSVPVTEALLMTTRSIIKKDPELVQRFVKAYLAAIHYYLSHRRESVAIMKKYMAVQNPANIEGLYESFAAQLDPFPLPNKESVKAMIDAAAAVDERARDMKEADLIDQHFLDELRASGFLNSLYVEKKSL